MKSDRAVGIAVALAGAGVALLAAAIDILPSQPTLSARFFPYLLAGSLTAGGALLAMRPGATALGERVRAVMAGRGVLMAATFIVYAVTFRHVDFRLGTWAFVLAAMLILGSRRPWELVIVPVAVSGLVYLLFRHGFTVLLPAWT